MPSDYSQANWQNDIPQDSNSQQQSQSTQQESPYKKMIMTQLSIAVVVSVLSVAAWEKVVSPIVDSFIPPFEKMSTEVSPDAADLLQASLKNCRSNANEYSRRACKSVWANVRIPSLDETANASVNVPR